MQAGKRARPSIIKIQRFSIEASTRAMAEQAQDRLQVCSPARLVNTGTEHATEKQGLSVGTSELEGRGGSGPVPKPLRWLAADETDDRTSVT